ncbi:hypothetical protein GQ43DRAFT_470649 [Delitschia confertaspora ATCC 74209]|uniref:Uncharacterized protein n=1 Tax=Delitschia confertaspora ATCC 74209 TaxID=1513339 RepID=A0A9P4JNU9_9PLEO|nr:hypothetical protein GQ43DRAFT_470649 [Delitschia confertaspora ATCC 74209]
MERKFKNMFSRKPSKGAQSDPGSIDQTMPSSTRAESTVPTTRRSSTALNNRYSSVGSKSRHSSTAVTLTSENTYSSGKKTHSSGDSRRSSNTGHSHSSSKSPLDSARTGMMSALASSRRSGQGSKHGSKSPDNTSSNSARSLSHNDHRTQVTVISTVATSPYTSLGGDTRLMTEKSTMKYGEDVANRNIEQSAHVRDPRRPSIYSITSSIRSGGRALGSLYENSLYESSSYEVSLYDSGDRAYPKYRHKAVSADGLDVLPKFEKKFGRDEGHIDYRRQRNPRATPVSDSSDYTRYVPRLPQKKIAEEAYVAGLQQATDGSDEAGQHQEPTQSEHYQLPYLGGLVNVDTTVEEFSHSRGDPTEPNVIAPITKTWTISSDNGPPRSEHHQVPYLGGTVDVDTSVTEFSRPRSVPAELESTGFEISTPATQDNTMTPEIIPHEGLLPLYTLDDKISELSDTQTYSSISKGRPFVPKSKECLEHWLSQNPDVEPDIVREMLEHLDEDPETVVEQWHLAPENQTSEGLYPTPPPVPPPTVMPHSDPEAPFHLHGSPFPPDSPIHLDHLSRSSDTSTFTYELPPNLPMTDAMKDSIPDMLPLTLKEITAPNSGWANPKPRVAKEKGVTESKSSSSSSSR